MQSQGSFKEAEGDRRLSQSVSYYNGSKAESAMALKVEQVAMSPGMLAASREEKGKGTESLLGPSGRDSAPATP